MARKFTVIDEGFTCAVCGAKVEPLGYTARDHCPFCLCSLHVDDFPGDREADCGGILRPVGILPHKKGLQIVYICEDCGAEKRNVAARDDDGEKLIALTTRGIYGIM